MLVFDVTRNITYKNLDKWYSGLRQHNPFVPVICVANKIDEDLSVTNRAFNFPTEIGCSLYFVSASTGVNVVRAFNESIRLAIESKTDPTDLAMAELMGLVTGQ